MRFTIRDLLWLTVIAGLCVGWWADHRAMARESLRRLSAFNTLAAFILMENGCETRDRGEVLEISRPDGSGKMIRIQ
jgi:hypothetical protein